MCRFKSDFSLAISIVPIGLMLIPFNPLQYNQNLPNLCKYATNYSPVVQACWCVGENSRVPVCHCRGVDHCLASTGHCLQLQLFLPQRNRSGGNAVTKF